MTRKRCTPMGSCDSHTPQRDSLSRRSTWRRATAMIWPPSPRRRLVHRALRRAPPETRNLEAPSFAELRATPLRERAAGDPPAPPEPRPAAARRWPPGSPDKRRTRPATFSSSVAASSARRSPSTPPGSAHVTLLEKASWVRGERTQRWDALRRWRPGARRRFERGSTCARAAPRSWRRWAAASSTRGGSTSPPRRPRCLLRQDFKAARSAGLRCTARGGRGARARARWRRRAPPPCTPRWAACSPGSRRSRSSRARWRRAARCARAPGGEPRRRRRLYEARRATATACSLQVVLAAGAWSARPRSACTCPACR